MRIDFRTVEDRDRIGCGGFIFSKGHDMIWMMKWLGVLLIGAGLASASPLGDEVQEKAVAILDSIEDPGSAKLGIERMKALADMVAISASDRQLDAVGVAEGYLVVAEMLEASGREDLGSFVDLLVESPGFVVELGLLIDKKHDDLGGVARAASELLESRGPAVEEFASLSSAICVVHDQHGDYTRRINENQVGSPERLEIFDFFVANGRRMPVSPNSLSPALMVHVVDMTETPEQSAWALNRYRGNMKIGDRFFEIQYDIEHFRSGALKKVTQSGDYKLQSILRFGGVCADQAYFAEGVAKASSIPSAYVYARGTDVSHAWIGYLEIRGKRAMWNFDSGRYPEYQNLRGRLLNPQTGKQVADARVGLLGGQYSTKDADRWAALGVSKAVRRMHTRQWMARDVDLSSKGIRREPREGTTKDQLSLLRAGLTRCAFVPEGWELMTEIAESESLKLGELDVWAQAVEKMCGTQYQDFSFDIVAALIESVDEYNDQAGMWEWAFNRYKARPDLAGAARIKQGKVYALLNDQDRAWRMYEDVSKRYINNGPMVLEALSQMALMLEVAGRRAEIIPYLQDAARRVQRPPAMGTAFASQSNYFQIQSSLAMELTNAGRRAESAAVLRSIGF